MNRIFVLLFALFGVAVAGGWTTFRSSALGFSIQHPSGWRVTARAAQVTFEALRADLAVASFTVNVYPAQSLDAWVRSRRATETLPDGSSRVERVRDARLGTRATKQLVLFAFDRSVLEEAVVVGKRLYVISFDEDNPNDPQFKAHKAMCQQMRSSLRFP
jgi:hypothetical protein